MNGAGTGMTRNIIVIALR